MPFPDFERTLGEEIKPDAIDNEMAASVVRLLRNEEFLYAHFLAAYRSCDGYVTIKFEVDVERPQKVAAAIARKELLIARFKKQTLPKVYALREGFPSDVPHLNLGSKDNPPWLCLDEKPWEEAKSRWTAFRFIERIRWWLSATSKGELHGDGQPVEPIIGSATALVIPPTFLTSDSDRTLEIEGFNTTSDPNTIYMKLGTQSGKPSDAFLPIPFTTKPLPIQRLRFAPENLEQLHETVHAWGVDLIGELRKLVNGLSKSDYRKLSCRPLILLHIPLLKLDGTSTGQYDLKAFLTAPNDDMSRIGVELGVFDSKPAENGRFGIRIPLATDMKGEKIPVVVASVHADYNREVAALGAGMPADNRAISLIGAGAIGSHLAEIMRRDGFGTWSVIDHDTLLPHNIQRHRLAASVVGVPKAMALADYLNVMMGVKQETTFTCANVLQTSDVAISNFKNAKLIVDASASVPVARWLSDLSDISAPRLSTFFNPAGQDVVLLAEDPSRKITLSALEAQYYRAILTNSSLADHLTTKGNGYQYAGSCRSVSFKMPEHQVSMLTGAIAGDVRLHLDNANATIVIWSGKLEGLKREAIPVYPVTHHLVDEWEIIIDQGLVESAVNLRNLALPNETGGILLGTIDIPRKQICLIQIVPAPADSDSSPAGFDRGVKNLKQIVEDANKKTAGQVEYIGEWHSHPTGVAPTPSTTDVKQLYWLGRERIVEELPAVMMIIGDNQSYTITMVIPATAY